jgi:hypothetical protein
MCELRVVLDRVWGLGVVIEIVEIREEVASMEMAKAPRP